MLADLLMTQISVCKGIDMNVHAQADKEHKKSLLLVDVSWNHTLHLANDLSDAGFKVFFLGDGSCKAHWLPDGVISLPRAPMSPDKIIGSIDAAVKAVKPDFVMPISEETLFRIWDESPDWLHLVQPVVEPERRALYRSKHLLGAFVHGHGVLIPATCLLEKGTLEEITPIISNLGLPAVVKGAGGVGGLQVKIVESCDEALKAVTALRHLTGSCPALQEFLPGPTYLVGGLFDRGRPVHMLAAEKTEMYPPRTGPAISLKSSCDPELIEAAAKVFGALGHTGIASADFVRGADGHFRFLEVNPRFWGSYGFAKTIGIDLVGSWCRLLCGEQLPTAVGHPAGRCWAKMPDYLLVPPLTRVNILRRALHPLAIRSWHWHAPAILTHQLRKAWYALRMA